MDKAGSKVNEDIPNKVGLGKASYSRNAYGETLVEIGKKDKNVVVLDADLSGSTRTAYFAKEFSDRFFNMGVAEQNMMVTAAGLASCGKIAFVSSFCMFATMRVLDQIRNTVSYNNLNVKIAVSHSGLTVGEDGSSHQALEDLAIMRAIPRMRVIVPCDSSQTKEAILCAYSQPGPFYIRFGRSKVPEIEGKDEFVLGKGQLLNRGKDVAIISTGIMVAQSVRALDELRASGINPYLANMPTIKPIDKELILDLAKKVKAFVVCEEHSIIGGLGSAVAEVLSENCPKKIKRIGVNDRFGQSGTPEQLLKEYGLEPEDIAKAVKEILR